MFAAKRKYDHSTSSTNDEYDVETICKKRFISDFANLSLNEIEYKTIIVEKPKEEKVANHCQTLALRTFSLSNISNYTNPVQNKKPVRKSPIAEPTSLNLSKNAQKIFDRCLRKMFTSQSLFNRLSFPKECFALVPYRALPFTLEIIKSISTTTMANPPTVLPEMIEEEEMKIELD